MVRWFLGETLPGESGEPGEAWRGLERTGLRHGRSGRAGGKQLEGNAFWQDEGNESSRFDAVEGCGTLSSGCALPRNCITDLVTSANRIAQPHAGGCTDSPRAASSKRSAGQQRPGRPHKRGPRVCVGRRSGQAGQAKSGGHFLQGSSGPAPGPEFAFQGGFCFPTRSQAFPVERLPARRTIGAEQATLCIRDPGTRSSSSLPAGSGHPHWPAASMPYLDG